MATQKRFIAYVTPKPEGAMAEFKLAAEVLSLSREGVDGGLAEGALLNAASLMTLGQLLGFASIPDGEMQARGLFDRQHWNKTYMERGDLRQSFWSAYRFLEISDKWDLNLVFTYE